MGKRRSRGRHSGENTPMHSDSSDGDSYSSKRNKPTKKQGPKTSAEICEDLRMENIELEFTEADYQNLTTFSLFSRLFRPQLVSLNPKASSAKMIQVMEAKWREFGKAKVAADVRRKAASIEARAKEEAAARAAAEAAAAAEAEEEEEDEEEEQEEVDSVGASEDGDEETAKGGEQTDEDEFAEVPDDDDEEDEQNEDDQDEEEEEEEEEIKPKKSKSRGRASTGTLRIKMPMIALRKSNRDRKQKNYTEGADTDSTSSSIHIQKKRRRKHSSGSSDSDFVALPTSKRRQKKVKISDDESESGDDGRRRSGRARKKTKARSDDEDSDESGLSRRKSRSRGKTVTPKSSAKKKKKMDSDEDAVLSSQDVSEAVSIGSEDSSDESEESTDDSDDSDLSEVNERRSKRKKRKQKKYVEEKPRIPGERKSDRQRKSLSKTVSDREFERLIKEDQYEKERKQKAEKKKKASLQKKKIRKMEKTRKGYWQDKLEMKEKEDENKEEEEEKKDEEDDGNESDHFWFCEMCKDGGDLLLCDTCPKSFHKECLKLEDVPDGDWSCPLCTGEGLPEDGESDVEHDQFCKNCGDGGDVILCDFCPLVYHMRCCITPLTKIPDGDWKCERCKIAENPPKAKVKLILTWRWSHHLKGEDELDHTHSPKKKVAPVVISEDGDSKDSKDSSAEVEKRPVRELYCKFEYHSFWDCEWIPELQLEIHQPSRWYVFKRKFDLDEPPALEDGSSYGKVRHKEDNEKDPHRLEERYYRYGIKPEWLQIQRIIAHEGNGRDTKYLVKWRDLAYDECTWEYPGEVHKALDEEFRRHVDVYWDRRKEKMSDKRKKDKPKKSTMRKKFEKQPDYISECGGTLHPYQLEGLNWLRFSYSQNTNTILADEMGLGKTIQTIVFLQSLFREGHSPGPFIVSAPLSTVPNWEREFEFWAPELYVVTYIGHRESRMVIRERDFCYRDGAFHMLVKPSKMREGFKPKFDVLLTSYEIVNTDQAALASIDWAVLTIDEAHRLKNNQSLFFQTMSSYKIQYKLLLTGTPLQNNLEELFNLLNFLEPGKFDSQEAFLEEFDNISKDMQVERLHNMLAPHMLRRLKADVLAEIPDKTELIVRIELAPMQKTFYKHILTKNFEALNVKGSSNQTSLMNIMMDLRKCCNHPYMFPTAHMEAPCLKNGLYEGNALIAACGKLVLLEKMLVVLREQKHRVLIFSQMTRCMDILEDFLEHLGYKYERIDGNVSSSKRQESIDRFNAEDSPQFVFLLSTKAGGLGINLATADTVIIFDMDWNPHNDIQAFSRAHRIGQKNKVMIYRFVSRNTVEEKMAQVCKRKMMLTELVIHRGMSSESKDSLSKQEVSDILKYGAEDLFQDEGKDIKYDNAAVEKLLDRSQDGEKVRELGMNDYLKSFRVASYQVKDNEPEPEPEVVEEEPVASSSKDTAMEDKAYWEKVLGDSYQEFTVQQIKEQEAIAKTLGKGKRLRRRVNYAEQQAMLELQASKKKKEKVVVEDALYLSDYEPTSSSSDEESGGDEEEEVIFPEKELSEIGVKRQIPRGRPKRTPEDPYTGKLKELPPLLAKVDGRIEVLGFSARQRRAFLDVIMKFGLPPGDVFNSQWRSRDLREKHEKILRAYSSLFMRHLCEPIADNAENFSDGIPREGLSRQHVLTRLGMIALIRKKVSEFEDVNGIDSMSEFDMAPRPVSGFRRGLLAKPADEVISKDRAELFSLLKPTDPDKEAEENKEKEKESEKSDDKKEENPEEGKKQADEKSDEPEKMETETESADKKKDDEQSNQETVTEKPSTEKSEDTEADAKETSSEDQKKEEKAEEAGSVPEASEDVSEGQTDAEKINNEAEDKEEDQKDSVKDKAQDEATKDKDVEMEDVSAEKPEKKATGPDTETVKDGDGDVEMKQEEKQTTEKAGKGDGDKAQDTETGDGMKDVDVKEEKSSDKDAVDAEPAEKGKEEEDEAKETEAGKDEKEDKVKDTNVSGSGDKKSEEDMKSETKSKDESGKASESSQKKKEPFRVKPYNELAQDLRKKLWIADGGFTELHALWQMEETTMNQRKPYETWHRRHDFWLLAGIITHGYRHWQDILNDARFEILNHVFKTDDARMKKAAFLNRRFQVLEQALVIEEQLHKAIKRNHGISSVQAAQENNDDLLALDKMAGHLRKVNQSKQKGNVDKRSIKALNQVGSLVQDIKQSSYSAMPASLAQFKPQAAPPQPQVQPKKVSPARSLLGKPGSNVPKYVSQMLSEKTTEQQKMILSRAVQQQMQQKKSGSQGKDIICLD